MTPVRILGSVLGILDGGWAAYVAADGTVQKNPCTALGPFCTGPTSAGPVDTLLLTLGAILFLVSAISFAGLRIAFMGGAGLAVLVIACVAIRWSSLAANDAAAAAVLSVATLLVDLVASRPARALSERDSPLNLPVFG